MALDAGQVIDGKYRVLRLIGEGGMGAVYEGENARIRRRVAIKTLHASIASNAEAVARFEREAQAAGRIGSDHILEVIDLGSLPSGERFIVMEFLDGEPLSARIARHGRLSPAQLMPIIRQVLKGLGAAHAAGIVHRDLKPDNIFILRQKAGLSDFVKIIDFGISKFHSDQDQSMAMTKAGSLMGTPLYMAPEQANGSSEADARSDIYSLGMIMYEALAGALPFSAQNLNELLFKIVLTEVPRLETVVPNLDPFVGALVARAVEKKPADRFASAEHMLAALEGGRVSGLPPAEITSTVSAPGGSWPGAVPYAATPHPMQTPHPALTPAPGQRTPGPPGPTPWPVPQAGGPTPWPVPQGGAVAPQLGTNGAWGQPSQSSDMASPPRKKTALVAGIAAAGVVTLLGLGVVLTRARHGAAAGTTGVLSADTTSTAAPPTSSAALAPTSVALVDPPVATIVDAGSGAVATVASQAPVTPPGPPVARGVPGGGGVRPPTPRGSAAPPSTGKTTKPDWGY